MFKKMNTRDVLLVAGGCLAGLVAGSIFIEKAKKELKKEIIAEEGKVIKREIKEQIKEEINVHDIKNEIKKNISKNIVEDILEQNKKDMAEVKSIIKKFEGELEDYEEQVMDYDKRIGKIVNGGIAAIMNNINRGN